MTNQTNEENENDNINTQRDILPVIMMVQNDEREGRKKKYNWDWGENEEEQNSKQYVLKYYDKSNTSKIFLSSCAI